MANILVLENREGNRIVFNVEIAASEKSRRLGLMYRQKLDERHGMWFDFGSDRRIKMWMKNTMISLDLIFLDAEGTVIQIESNRRPMSLAIVESRLPARFVLEINGGESSAFGIDIGSRTLLMP